MANYQMIANCGIEAGALLLGLLSVVWGHNNPSSKDKRYSPSALCLLQHIRLLVRNRVEGFGRHLEVRAGSGLRIVP